MGREPAELKPSFPRKFLGRFKKAFETWWPESPILWIGVFAALYVVTYWATILPTQIWEVVPDRISLLYLPSFIRVVAVLVAGFAGLIGVFIGSLLAAMIFVGDSLLDATWIALASSAGAFAACWLMRQALVTDSLPFTLPVLLVMSVMYSAFNAVLHGLIWSFIGGYESVTLDHVAMMMIGDFFGVIAGFVVTRIGLRLLKLTGLLPRSSG
jgi:hypothetical protein